MYCDVNSEKNNDFLVPVSLKLDWQVATQFIFNGHYK